MQRPGFSHPLETGLRPQGNGTDVLQTSWVQVRMCIVPLSLPSSSKPRAGCSKQPPRSLPWVCRAGLGLALCRAFQARTGWCTGLRLCPILRRSRGRPLRCRAQGVAQPHTSAPAKKTQGKSPLPYFSSHLCEAQLQRRSNFRFHLNPDRLSLLPGELTHPHVWPYVCTHSLSLAHIHKCAHTDTHTHTHPPPSCA